MADVNIFVGNNTIVDPEVYQLWLNGYTAHEAAIFLQKKDVLKAFGATFDMLLHDILDHYRTFSMLERLLKNPTRLTEQCQFQIAPETRSLLIERYYSFDSTVIREFLGKKLSSRYRNSLDDISEKTKVPLRSCRRQFDNVKRVFKMVEEMMGSLVGNIQSHFLLSDKLAEQYAAIVFITNNRFETGKKKLTYLTFADFATCANFMIVNWSYSSKDCSEHEDMDVDLDRDFLHGLRELKVLAEKENMEDHKTLVQKSLQVKLTTSAQADLETNFKVLSKTLVNIAYGLNHSKELRDLFLDLVEKFIDPCRQGGWTTADVTEFLKSFQETSHQLDIIRRQSPLVTRVWDRYISTVSSCILQMYHN